MKTFEETLDEVLLNRYEIRTDINLANLKGTYPHLWTAIQEAAEEYAREHHKFNIEHTPTQVGNCSIKTNPGPLTDEERKIVGEYLDSIDTEIPQSNCRIITKIGG